MLDQQFELYLSKATVFVSGDDFEWEADFTPDEILKGLPNLFDIRKIGFIELLWYKLQYLPILFIDIFDDESKKKINNMKVSIGDKGTILYSRAENSLIAEMSYENEYTAKFIYKKYNGKFVLHNEDGPAIHIKYASTKLLDMGFPILLFNIRHKKRSGLLNIFRKKPTNRPRNIKYDTLTLWYMNGKSERHNNEPTVYLYNDGKEVLIGDL